MSDAAVLTQILLCIILAYALKRVPVKSHMATWKETVAIGVQIVILILVYMTNNKFLNVLSHLILAYTYFLVILRFQVVRNLKIPVMLSFVLGIALITVLTPYTYVGPIIVLLPFSIWLMKQFSFDRKYIVLFFLCNTLGAFSLYMGLTDSAVWMEETVLFIRVAFYVLLILVTLDYQSKIIEGTYVKAVSDSLTGLFNNKKIKQMINSFVDAKIEFGLMFLDLDNFKSINQAAGHAAGDDALRRVAGIISEEFESTGFVGRYGGEEIVAILSGHEPSTLRDICERVRIRIEAEVTYQIEQTIQNVTASIGCVNWADEWTAEECLTHANIAMFKAKELGKNRVVEYKGSS